MICQEPLNKNLELPDVPIWNQLDTNSSYRVYSVSTLAGEVGHPNGHSKNCLSCHDGTIAEDLLQ